MGRSLDDLGTRRLSWLDLAAVIRHSPAGSAIDLETRGQAALYGVTERLLTIIANALRDANWQRAQDERAPRPKLIPVPGSMERDDDGEGYGSEAIPISDFADWWDSTE